MFCEIKKQQKLGISGGGWKGGGMEGGGGGGGDSLGRTHKRSVYYTIHVIIHDTGFPLYITPIIYIDGIRSLQGSNIR